MSAFSKFYTIKFTYINLQCFYYREALVGVKPGMANCFTIIRHMSCKYEII